MWLYCSVVHVVYLTVGGGVEYDTSWMKTNLVGVDVPRKCSSTVPPRCISWVQL
jgi:hypothetical protein